MPRWKGGARRNRRAWVRSPIDMRGKPVREECEELELADAASTLLDECRMVLPGIQALFGFQLIAVFNQRFADDLDKPDQLLHLAAISLVAIAVALVMTPAAYHRHRGARVVTDTFIHLSSLLLVASMVPLALGLSIDLYVIAKLIVDNDALGVPIAVGLFAFMSFCWFVFPRLTPLHEGVMKVHAKPGEG